MATCLYGMANMANDALAAEMLDLIVNDSENLERTLNLLTDNVVLGPRAGETR
jgi:hypothetical protein